MPNFFKKKYSPNPNKWIIVYATQVDNDVVL